MNRPDILALACGLVPRAYLEQGASELSRRENAIRSLLASRALPDAGWPDSTTEYFLAQLALLDSNNFSAAVGAGEREGRIFSALVRRRHYGLGHGIGRSGDIAAVQPKAAGSSLLAKLTNRLALHAVRLCGVLRAEAALVLPTATGLSISLTLLALLDARRREARAAAAADGAAAALAAVEPRYVLWSRIDQKSCYKAVLLAGLEPVVVELRRDGDELRTDVAALAAALARLPALAVVAVVTTTSCFAPRAPDDVVDVAQLCRAAGVPHVINHAYGLQLSGACHAVNEACRLGRVDAVVSSTDKNFMVPVGGAIVFSPSADAVSAVARVYPGRASVAPILDLFMTFLGMGVLGLRELLARRKEVGRHLRQQLVALAATYGERVLDSSRNHISFAMTISRITTAPETAAALRRAAVPPAAAAATTGGAAAAGGGVEGGGGSPLAGAAPAAFEATGVAADSTSDATRGATYLGSMLFSRGVSGSRVVHPAGSQSIDGRVFAGYGAHCDSYPEPYLTVAAALGMTAEDVDTLMLRMARTIDEFLRQQMGSTAAPAPAPA